ncbi:hypothetical protein ACKLTP_18715 [Paenarthrobacter ureafaciens]
MKIALFDGIVETHVASSLERALVAAGQVLRILDGFQESQRPSLRE